MSRPGAQLVSGRGKIRAQACLTLAPQCVPYPLPPEHANIRLPLPLLHLLGAQVYRESDLSAHICNLSSGRQENPSDRSGHVLSVVVAAAAAERRTVGPQRQNWRLPPAASGRPGSGARAGWGRREGSSAGLRAMTSALLWCSVQSPLVGVARDTPSPERNKTGRGPGAPSRHFRERSHPPGECAPRPRGPARSLRALPAPRCTRAAPARPPGRRGPTLLESKVGRPRGGGRRGPRSGRSGHT